VELLLGVRVGVRKEEQSQVRQVEELRCGAGIPSAATIVTPNYSIGFLVFWTLIGFI
jgi:hypothetical protein